MRVAVPVSSAYAARAGEVSQACSLDQKNTNFVCQALPCFGGAFVQKAVEAFPGLDERKQTRLVFCIAKTGTNCVSSLVRFLEHPSANVRAAACVGLADIIDPWEGGHAPVILQLREAFLRKANVSKEDADAYIAKENVLWDSPEAKLSLNAEVPIALVKRLADEYRPVRLAVVATLSWFLQNCRIEVGIREGIVTALLKTLEDDCQLVRIAAMDALAFLKIQGVSLGEDDAGLYRRRFEAKDHE